MSKSDMLWLTFQKGGLSMIAAEYISMGKLNPSQMEFFFKSGAILQLVDDLIDISEDLDESILTIWTHSLNKNNDIIDPLKRLLQIEADFELQIPRLSSGFTHGKIPKLYQKSFKVLTVIGIIRQNDPRIKNSYSLLKKYLPLSPAHIIRLMRTVALEMMPRQTGFCSSLFERIMGKIPQTP